MDYGHTQGFEMKTVSPLQVANHLFMLNLLLLESLAVIIAVADATLDLAFENTSIVVNGVKDECKEGALLSAHFACVCVTGLWALYDSHCSSPLTIVGAQTKKCFKLDSHIERVLPLSCDINFHTFSSATAVDARIQSVGGSFTRSENSSSRTNFVQQGHPLLITTGLQQWRIPERKLCLLPTALMLNQTNFCLFNLSVEEEYRLVNEKCHKEDKTLLPWKCYPFLDEGYDASSCEKRLPYTFHRDIHNNLRKKRGADDMETTTATDVDENNGLLNKVDFTFMNTEIWNFITYRAEVRLGIRQTKEPADNTWYSPAFAFLEKAKRIQQKACPEHYVRDEHYDIAIGAFESLQRNTYGFEEDHLEYATSERIMDALSRCLDDMEEYPFLVRNGKKASHCNNTVFTHGTYKMFDHVMELTLTKDQASRTNEPIVETVWKVFVHAHSACFNYFNESYNDHHRFATVMAALFTNQANDLWFSVSQLHSHVYNGFLGDAIDLMDSVAYCAMFSRLDSEYPWDLPRPRKNYAKRKRRSSENNPRSFKCLSESQGIQSCQSKVDNSFNGENDIPEY